MHAGRTRFTRKARARERWEGGRVAEGERERACVPVPLSSGEREEDTHAHFSSKKAVLFVCVFYYCRTYYKAVRVGGGGEWRTCAMRDN